jgi:hypothetical protein
MNGEQGEDEQRSQWSSRPISINRETFWGIYWGKRIDMHGMIVIATIKPCRELVAWEVRDLDSLGNGLSTPRVAQQQAAFAKRQRHTRLFKEIA